MDFAVLGPLEVRTAGGPVSLGGERQQRLLAALLLDFGRPLGIDDLVGALWDGEPPVTARRQVHNGVWQLRRALAGTGAVLSNEAPGYRLQIDTSRFDLKRFEWGLAESRRRAAASDQLGAARTLRDVLALWRGPALAGLTGQVLEREAARLNELRLAAIEDCVEHELACGVHQDLTAELTALVDEHPTRERLVAALILALCRGSRQAEALAVYHQAAKQLRETMGVDPGPMLRRRFEEVLRGEIAATPPAVVVSPPAEGSAGARRCLPPKPGRLAGRTALLDRMLRGIGEGAATARPVTFVITGMPGVGKTALAVYLGYEASERYPDAQLFLDLQGHSDRAPLSPADALGALLSQLGVHSSQIPEDLAGRTSQWRTELAARRAVVVLDNAAGSAQLGPLLPGQSNTLVLVTSRGTLGPVDGARPVSLDLLEVDEAVQLLRHAVADRVDLDPAAAAEVAELCGRLPLALRLAAHRLHDRPMWTMAGLAEQLRAADPPTIEVAVEGRSAAAAFAMSYRQLDQPLQRLFRLLGLHPASAFQAHAAAALADQSVATTRRMLDQLVDGHLVRADTPGRYRLHDLLRDFAASLVTPEEADSALTRMLDYYLHTAAGVTAYWEKSAVRVSLDFGPVTYRQEFATPEAAIEWLHAEILTIAAATDLAASLGRHRHACLLPRAAWHFMYHQGHNQLGMRLQLQALPSARALGDRRLEAMTHAYLAGSYFRLSEFNTSLNHLAEATRLYEEADDRVGLATTLANAASITFHFGRFATSVEQANAALAVSRSIGSQAIASRAMNSLGITKRQMGEPREALALHRRILAELWLTDEQFRFPLILGEVARDHLLLGHARLAVLLFNRALKGKRRAGNRPGGAETLSDLGTALAALGRLDEALAKHVEALQEMRGLADPAGTAMVANDLGRTLTALGRFDEAIAHHREAIDLGRQYGMRYDVARGFAGVAAALEASDPAQAREHWQRALKLFAEMGTPEADEIARRLAE